MTLKDKGIVVQHMVEEFCVNVRQRMLSLEIRRNWTRVTVGTDTFINVEREGKESTRRELPFFSVN